MEIDVTALVKHFNYADAYKPLVGSVYELGDNAASKTWRNACEYAEEHPLLTTPEQIEAARSHFKGYGAWDAEELADDSTIQGLAVQEVASVLWEHRDAEEWDDCRFFKCDIEGNPAFGRYFYYFGE